MRLTSDFWVTALIRRVQGEGGFAYLARRGAPEAGAIFIKVSTRSGTCDLFTPAPQTSYGDESDGGRLFLRLLHNVEQTEADEKMQREIRFDPDLWIIELEDVADVATFFDVAVDDRFF